MAWYHQEHNSREPEFGTIESQLRDLKFPLYLHVVQHTFHIWLHTHPFYGLQIANIGTPKPTL